MAGGTFDPSTLRHAYPDSWLAEVREMAAAGDLTAYIRVDRATRWELLREHLADASPQETADILRAWWTDAEFIERDQALAWFKRAGFVSDNTKTLDGTLTIYRGICWVAELDDPAGPDSGIAWTLSKERAEFFARRNAKFTGDEGDPWVLTATVEASKVLGYFTDREEDEIMVDPDDMNVIREERLT